MAQRKGTAKLNDLLEIERQVQERWKKEKVFEKNAPPLGSKEAKLDLLDIINRLVNVHYLFN